MKNKLIASMFLSILLIPISSYGQILSDYLILQDIGQYKMTVPKELIPGVAPVGGPRVNDGGGILAATGHSPDHGDKTYVLKYLGGGTNASPTVTITQHTGGDSDRWLLHEVEDSYRTNDRSRLGLLSQGAVIKRLAVGGDRMFSIRYGGGSYMWVSNNVVIHIDYTDMQGNKPQPREIILAYLQKFPSTIPATLVLDSAHDVQWIKDEMERRLWLCDKCFAQLQAGTAQQKDALQTIVKSLIVFLSYREKYYDLAATDDKNLLVGYMNTNNTASIQAKLTEYKTWWGQHKEDTITLP